MRRPVKPRDAASLLIVREGDAGHEVLMGRRPSRDRFMPDVYVFPGGRVDESDSLIPVASELAERERVRFLGRVSERRARMLGVAAIRETHEETGLMIGERDDRGLRPDLGALEYLARAITPTQSQIRYHARFFLVHARSVRGALRSNGELLDLCWLPLEKARALPLVDVTRYVLEEAEHRVRGGAFRGVPLISYRAGAIRLRFETAGG